MYKLKEGMHYSTFHYISGLTDLVPYCQLHFWQERIQRDLGKGKLHKEDWDLIMGEIRNITKEHDMWVIFDIHNYARYNKGDSMTNDGTETIGVTATI